jgi:hypothetical protein
MMYQTYIANNKLKQNIAILGAFALTAALASQARADIQYTISSSEADLSAVNVTVNNTAYTGVLAGGIIVNAKAGQSLGTAPSSFVSVCSDFNGALYLGSTYSFNAPVSTVSVENGTANYTPDPNWNNDPYALQNAAALFAAHNSVLSGGGAKAAGLQLAIWTALYDSIGTTGDRIVLNSSSYFQAENYANPTQGSAAYYMNLYLSNLGTPGDVPSVSILTPGPDSSTNNGVNSGYGSSEPPQALLVYTPVPEASTVLSGSLLLLSFGVCSLKSFGKFRA